MNHKELVRVIYNGLVGRGRMDTMRAVDVATWVAHDLAKQADGGYLGYGGPSDLEAPAKPPRVAITANSTFDMHGHRHLTAVGTDGTIWTKGPNGLWDRHSPLPQD
jgi:hypothetical protein